MKHAALFLSTLLLGSCALVQTPCERADRRIGRAIALCPKRLQADTATVQLPGDSATLSAPAYAHLDVDSLLAACAQLADALAAERDLYAAMMQKPPAPGAPVEHYTAPVRRAAAAVRAQACRYEPFTYEHELFTVIGRGGEAPNLQVQVKDRRVATPCPPKVEMVRREGVATWYRTFFWVLVATVVAYILGRFARKWVLGLLLLLPLASPAQERVNTLSDRRPGQRQLVLTGTVTGADSAYLQVYSDGDELLDDVVTGTWTLTLGDRDWYVLQFTDAAGRVKRIHVAELSEDLVEFYPAIEVDFDREGNLALMKPSHRKPGWVEYDIGMSRPRKN